MILWDLLRQSRRCTVVGKIGTPLCHYWAISAQRFLTVFSSAEKENCPKHLLNYLFSFFFEPNVQIKYVTYVMLNYKNKYEHHHIQYIEVLRKRTIKIGTPAISRR